MPEVIASLFAWKRGFALPHRLTLTCKNKGKRPGKFTIIETKEVKTSLKACMVDFGHYISQIQVSVDK